MLFLDALLLDTRERGGHRYASGGLANSFRSISVRSPPTATLPCRLHLTHVQGFSDVFAMSNSNESVFLSGNNSALCDTAW